MKELRLGILDRYMIQDLVGPFLVGLGAFSSIFAATEILAISRLVAQQHAPLVAVIEYFLWQMPQIIVTVVPMAMLLGVLLEMQRLSGDSEITAMKAAGISLVRIVQPLLVAGLAVSLAVLALQEELVPYANDQARYIREDVIKQVATFGGDASISIGLPGGWRQFTTWLGYDPATQTLRDVTVIQYDQYGRAQVIIMSDRATYEAPSWHFENAKEYSFHSDTDEIVTRQAPDERVNIGERPSEIARRITNDTPENMSRAQIKEILQSGILSSSDTRSYESTYEEKLARPFASFVITLIAVPFGLRPVRGGGGVGLGFGIAIAIAFIYYVIASISSAVFQTLPGGLVVSALGAWLPNLLFTAIGVVMLRRAAAH